MARILVVDDQLVMRELVKTTLATMNHEVTTAEDGVPALEIARTNEFDLVITDINMPVMNGISLVSKLRRISHMENVPILMLTTESSDFKKEKSKRMGANGWIQKPFTPDRLTKAVSTMLAKSA